MTDETLEKAKDIKKEIEYWEEFKQAIIYSRAQNEFYLNIYYIMDMEQCNFKTDNKKSNDKCVNEEISSMILDYVKSRLEEAEEEFKNL